MISIPKIYMHSLAVQQSITNCNFEYSDLINQSEAVFMNEDSSVCLVMGYRSNDWDSIPSKGVRFFSTSQHLDYLWGQP
jgi:hypothetical protein